MTFPPPPSGEASASADYVALCDKYLPLVHHAVASYAYRLPGYVDLDDLTGAAILGLVEAARRFDPDRGVPFEPWALQRIRGAILDAARSADTASRRTRKESRAVEAAIDALVAKLHRSPTEDEISAELGVSRSDLDDLRARVYRGLVVSLDDSAQGDDGVSFSDMLVDADLPPLETLERRELDSYVRDCVDVLPDRLRHIVVAYYFEGTSSADLAQQLGVTESRISQMRSEAIRLLRGALGTQYEEIKARTERSASLDPKAADLAQQAVARSSYTQRLEHRTEATL